MLVDVWPVTSVLGVAEVHPSAARQSGANGNEVKAWRTGSDGRANTRVQEQAADER